MTLLDRVTAILDAAGLPHALIGAAALAAAGAARSTFDIDLLVVERRVLDDDLWAPLRGERVTVEVRRGDPDDPLAGVVRCEAPGERPVDVVVGRHAWQARALARAERSPGGPPIVRPIDLVLLKLYAGGPQDLWDIRQILVAPGGADLAAEVDAEVGGLDPAARRLWESVRDSCR